MKSMKQIIKGYTSMSLVLRIFIGLAIGAALGLLVPSWTAVGILGRMFVGALKSIAPVLVAVLVTSSIARARECKKTPLFAHRTPSSKDSRMIVLLRRHSARTLAEPIRFR